MDSINAKNVNPEGRLIQEKILLDIIRDVCANLENKLTSKVVGKVNNILANCDLTHYLSLHKLNTADESTGTLLGITLQTAAELTFEEQAELNQSIFNKIPIYKTELEKLKQNDNQFKKSQINDLHISVNEKLNVLREQENKKLELMMEWINHRLHDLSAFNVDVIELSVFKTRILELKVKILHQQILLNMYSETDRGIKAYSTIQKDLEKSIVETELKIKQYKEIIENEE